MIQIDFSQVYLAPIFLDAAAKSCAQNPSTESRDMMMHMVLNTIRSQQVMHKSKYGSEVVVAFDSSSWRNDVFPYYKWARKQKRAVDTSGIKWDFVFETSAYIKQALIDYFPFNTISVDKAEADDIIGAICKYKDLNRDDQEENIFGDVEADEILVVSSDKDHYQLHRYKNVRQWSPLTKKLVKPDGQPQHALIEKIVRGDSGDGIPSIKCSDDWFTLTDKNRAPPISTKYLQTFFGAKNPIDACLTEEERRNYSRNEMLVSYEHTPEKIYNSTIACYNEQKGKKVDKMKLMNFFVNHKMNVLYSKIGDFF
jgi:hypothetical protein